MTCFKGETSDYSTGNILCFWLADMWITHPRYARGYESTAKAFRRLWLGSGRMFLLFLPAQASHDLGGAPLRPPAHLWKFTALVGWVGRYPKRLQDTFGRARHAVRGANLPKFRTLHAASPVRSIGGFLPLSLRLHFGGVYKACDESKRKSHPERRAPSLRLLRVAVPGSLQFAAGSTGGAMETTPEVCSAVPSAGILMHRSIVGHGLPTGCCRHLDSISDFSFAFCYESTLTGRIY